MLKFEKTKDPKALRRLYADCLNNCIKKFQLGAIIQRYAVDSKKTEHSDSLNIQSSIFSSQFRLVRVRRFEYDSCKMGSVQGCGEASEPN